MPTIEQLPTAQSIAPEDEIPLSQAGTTRAARVSELLSGLQPLITMSPGSLLGRCSAGDGSVELVMPGTGVSVSGGSLAATGADHVRFALISDLAQVDDIVVNASGNPCRVPVTSLRQMFHAGLNVTIDASGVISVPRMTLGTGSPVATMATIGDSYVDTQSGTVWSFGGGGWNPTGGLLLEALISVGGTGVTAAPVQLLPRTGASMSVKVPDQRCLVRITGTAAVQDLGSGDVTVWDIAAAAKRIGAGGAVSLVGAPSISVFASDASTSACGLAIGAAQQGILLSGNGLAGRSLQWSATLVVTVCA